MSAKPSEVYQSLKDLRRQGDGAEIRLKIGRQLKAMVDDVVAQNRPDRFGALLRNLDSSEDVVGEGDQTAGLMRALEIKTLADRVFGDESKAEAWLQRPNTSLSGQRPADLLGDELGTAVVREMLERIDHGIFA